MIKLTRIPVAILRFVEQMGLFPRSIATAIRYRRRQVSIRENETERLDRILHPSKYRGK